MCSPSGYGSGSGPGWAQCFNTRFLLSSRANSRSVGDVFRDGPLLDESDLRPRFCERSLRGGVAMPREASQAALNDRAAPSPARLIEFEGRRRVFIGPRTLDTC
jgi:hypothetical protein